MTVGFADNAAGSLQLAGAAARFAPLADEFALRVENGDRMFPFVGHIDVAVLADGNAKRPYGVFFRVSVGCEFRQQLLLAPTAGLDVIAARSEVVFVATICNGTMAIKAEAHGLRVVACGASGCRPS